MINGRFYFKQTANGNLIGEYSNQRSPRNTAESCDFNGNFNNLGIQFLGDYTSTWFEQDERQPVSMQLNIRNDKEGSLGRIFTLTWSNGNSPVFHGEGFIVDNMWIGNYWDSILQGMMDSRRRNIQNGTAQ